MSEFWHKIGCCVVAKPPPVSLKIDRSMIGEPTNFVHLTHIGSGEMAEGRAPVREMIPILTGVVCLTMC
uniref:CDC42 small effector 1 n=1 Tax=Hucho hucho TaxID=62062 RepID=A0A4W5LZ76_9TELE